MRLEVAGYSENSFSRVAVKHGDETLLFDAGSYKNTRGANINKRTGEELLFKEINDLISRLPKTKQDDLFEHYARLESYLQDFDWQQDEDEGKNVFNFMADLTVGIYKHIKYSDLVDYIRSTSAMKLPPDVHPRYTTDDKITQSYIDKTYLVDDYIHLMAFVMAQRLMIPLWGPYVNILKKTDGNDMKDYIAFKLLRKTEFWNCQAMERAQEYVESNMDKTVKSLSSMLNFIHKDEIPIYLIAITSLRKLSISAIAYTTQTDHLMPILHNFALNQFKSMDNRIQSDVFAKKNNHEFADDNTSVFGQFKMKEQISIVDLEINQQYVAGYQRAARKIEPTVVPEHVEACVQAALAIKDYRPADHQRTLASWVMSYVIPGTVLPMFDKRHRLICLGISQAVLWAWGYHEMAILITAKPIPRDEDEFRSREGRTTLSKDMLEQLHVIFPQTMPPDPTIPGGDSPNVGVRGIERIASVFNKDEWEPLCPRELAMLHDRADLSRCIDPSRNLRDQLASLLIRLDSQI